MGLTKTWSLTGKNPQRPERLRMRDGSGNVPEALVGLVPRGSQLRSLTRPPMHSPLTSHRKGLIQRAAGRTGGECNLPERLGRSQEFGQEWEFGQGKRFEVSHAPRRRSNVPTPSLTPSVSRRCGAGIRARQQPQEDPAHPIAAFVGINGNYGPGESSLRPGEGAPGPGAGSGPAWSGSRDHPQHRNTLPLPYPFYPFFPLKTRLEASGPEAGQHRPRRLRPARPPGMAPRAGSLPGPYWHHVAPCSAVSPRVPPFSPRVPSRVPPALTLRLIARRRRRRSVTARCRKASAS